MIGGGSHSSPHRAVWTPNAPQLNARLRAEVLALRHQLRVLERQTHRPRWQPTDRLVLAAISRVLTRQLWRSLMPSPETLLRWHRELVRRKWAVYRRRPSSRRPNPRSELHELILKLAGENDGWRYRRIVGELRKLGDRCSNMTVRKVLRHRGLEPVPRRSQRSWQGSCASTPTRSWLATSSAWIRSGCPGCMSCPSSRSAAGVCTWPAAPTARAKSGWCSRRGTWPGSCRTARCRPASCSEIGTRSSAPASTRSSRVRAWRSSGLPFRAPRSNAYSESWVRTARREV